MTRSEERLRVGVQRRATERVRLRKYIVEEEVTQTVVVRREELRIEREPFTGVEPTTGSGGSGSAEDYEIILYAERPVLRTEIVPVERILVRTEVITEQISVSDQLRKERIDLDVNDNRRTER